MGLNQFRIEFKLNRRPQYSEIDKLREVVVDVSEYVFKGDPLIQFEQSSVFFKTESIRVSYTEDVDVETIAQQGAEDIMARVNEYLSKREDFNGRVPVIGRQLKITGYNIEGI